MKAKLNRLSLPFALWAAVLPLSAQVAELPAPIIDPIVAPIPPTDSEDSSVQSPARPYNLDIVGPVQASGSDAEAVKFNQALPLLQTVISTQLPEKSNNSAAGDFDPSKLVLDQNYFVRAYFVSEGAGWANTLGFNTIAPTVAGQITSSEDAKLIFPDASSPTGLANSSGQNTSTPLVAGDFVDLGLFSEGTTLDFFLISKGATAPYKDYSTQAWFNTDGLTHAVGLSETGSTYLLYGFEDMHSTSGDRDMNDVVFALEFRIAAPEPSLAMGASLLSLMAMGIRRRRR